MPDAIPDGSVPEAPGGVERGTVVLRGLRAKVSWAFAGNVAYAGCNWALLVVLARYGGADFIGRFSLALALTAPLALLLNLQLRAIVAADARRRFPLSACVAVRTACMGVLLVCVAALAFGLGYPEATARVILAVGACKAIYGGSDLLHGLFQRQERMDLVGRSQILRGVLSLVAMFVALSAYRSLGWATLGMAAAWLGVFLFFDLPHAVRLAGGVKASDLLPARDASVIKLMAREAVPLGLSSTLMSFNTTIPRYLLEGYHGETSLGYFAAVAAVPQIGMLLVEALGQSAMPRLARLYVQDRLGYRRQLLWLVGVVAAFAAVCLAGVAVLGGPVLALLFRSQYAEHAPLLIRLMAVGGGVYLCSIFGVGLTAAGCLRAQLPVLVASILATLVAGLWLIPSGGMQGAAWTLGIGTLVWLVAIGALTIRVATQPWGAFQAAVPAVPRSSGEGGLNA